MVNVALLLSSLQKSAAKAKLPLEKRKLDLLQEMSVVIQKPANNCFGTFGNQVAEELRLILQKKKKPQKNLKKRLKRKIMNDVYEAQECDQPVSMPSLYLL